MQKSNEHIFLSNSMTSALESNGEIDWFPCPRFDSDSIFSKILGDDRAGYFSIKPKLDYTLHTSYVGNSLAVLNTFETKKGRLKLIDFIPLGMPAIMRIFDSEIPFTVDVKPVFRYGSIKAEVSKETNGFTFRNPKAEDSLEIGIKGKYSEDKEGRITVEKGRGHVFALYSKNSRYGLFGSGGSVFGHPNEAYESMIKYWNMQISMARSVSTFKKAYQRSIATILGLMYLPSGAVIAASSASLPEIIGGLRNWDYRYVWIRDASYAANSLSKAGLFSKSRRILNFMISVVDPSSKTFNHPLYSVDGTAPAPEETLSWLAGNRNSKPVRIGNDAYIQMQKDIEGAFMDALYVYTVNSKDTVLAQESWWVVESIARWVTSSWKDKSISLWEERSEQKHYVHTKLMDYVSLDRASKLAKILDKQDFTYKWDKIKSAIKNDFLKNGFSTKRGAFVNYYGSESLDASLLCLPLYDAIDISDKRFLSTLSQIEAELSVDEGLLLRYKSDFAGDVVHPFTLLSTWLARVYIKLGELDKAKHIINILIDNSTSQYLMSEHVDHILNESRGNFPQLFPHAGLVEAIIDYEDKKIS